MKYCPKCKLEKETNSFGKNSSNYDGLQDYCKVCKAERDRSYYRHNTQAHYVRRRRYTDNNRIQLWKYLQSHPCVDCGSSNPIILEFDHVHGKKLFAVSRMVIKYSWKHIQDEIAKCEVRCANCHRIKTAKQKGWYKFLTP